MRKLFNIFTIALLAMGFASCEPTDEPTTEAKKPVLTADKTEILANGTDAVTFTATIDGEENSEIQIISLKDNSVLSGNTFTTTAHGTYQFKAIYGKESSDVVEITATEVDKIIVLTADKQEIVADSTDAVTFSVTVDGAEVTNGYEIINLNFNADIQGNVFTSDVTGEFEFQAKYEGKWLSNKVNVIVNEVPKPEYKELKITATPNRIKADGIEEAVFTVTYGDEDVTADAKIYNTRTNEVIESKKFSTTEVGAHKFRASYNGETTGTSATVDAYDPNLEGKYEVGAIHEVNGVKGIIYAIKPDNKGNTWGYIFSLDEEDLAWSTVCEDCNCINEIGEWNTYDPFNYFGMDIANYPAFKWCMDHGEGWFMPSYVELNWIWEAITNGARNFNAPSVAEWNKLLTDNGGEPFQETFYWSSNETSSDMATTVAFMDDSVVCLDPTKDKPYSVRAAYRFKVE